MNNLITWETLTIFVMMFPFIIITIIFMSLCILGHCIKLVRRCVRGYSGFKEVTEVKTNGI